MSGGSRPTTVGEVGVPSVGERLEEARKKKGISIREAAEATKIRGDYLQKFESNQFDVGLTELYVRGFLRNYANFLKLPADRILNDYSALGHDQPKPRQPGREVYGRMEVSIASAEDREEPAGHAPAPAAAPQESRRSPHVPRSGELPHGTALDPSFMQTLAREVLRMEWEFHKAAGCTEAADELPAFFYNETLAPTGKTARHHSAQINRRVRELIA